MTMALSLSDQLCDIQQRQDIQEKLLRLNKSIIFDENSSQDEDANGNLIEFSSEVDNYVSETKIKSALYGPVMDTAGNIQGAIQVVNKTNPSEVFDEGNASEFKFICDVIGTAVRNAN